MNAESGLPLLACTEPAACATLFLVYTQLPELGLGRNQGPLKRLESDLESVANQDTSLPSLYVFPSYLTARQLQKMHQRVMS